MRIYTSDHARVNNMTEPAEQIPGAMTGLRCTLATWGTSSCSSSGRKYLSCGSCRWRASSPLMACEFSPYCLVLGVLPHDSLWRVADIVEMPPGHTIHHHRTAPLGGTSDDRVLECREALSVASCW
jgi:hypothetical protein